MKTSHKILIAFGAFLLIVTTGLYFLAPKLHEKKKAENTITQYFPLPEIHVVVGAPKTYFNVKSSPINQIEVKYQKNKAPQKGFYEVRNDTLYIKNTHISNEYWLTVNCRTVHSIIAQNNSNINVDRKDLSPLNLEAKGGRIDFGNEQKDSKKGLYINAKASNKGEITLSGCQIRQMNLFMDNGTLNGQNGTVENLQVKMVNHSNINMDFDPLKVSVERDSTSQYYL
jgi:hypothetical protein